MILDRLPLGAVLRRAREDVAMSQTALAAATGLRQPNIAAIEAGARRPSPELLERLLRAARLRPSIVLEYLADDVRQLAVEHGLSDVRVFGSAARGSDDERSDIDLLVAADPSVDFLRLAAFRGRAEELLGFPVDVVIDSPDDDVVAAIRREAVPL
ncbi:XRE family transcriptional regulator [Rathayibacter sp. Leaf296]|uniref:XRE family transcriptional regulator n=1 Tax=Rathayibacter sp. Leaf296 TaxID=1736327 RepID=UPI000AED482E|nr:XRE family transcriptional regulator [Rathayibacter sp. Leaf296]